ncbi:uncharacterized protein IUM83_06313 [Phytophthora cinnamomi]|uniref:uncharacterized protein n=1 Tax=Phytophthora cinnamomi TaxID=4785 RepID=UPI003559C85D|nr:hypothetical protein IUM83_06313 [Phytophthora cinnamomi]
MWLVAASMAFSTVREYTSVGCASRVGSATVFLSSQKASATGQQNSLPLGSGAMMFLVVGNSASPSTGSHLNLTTAPALSLRMIWSMLCSTAGLDVGM